MLDVIRPLKKRGDLNLALLLRFMMSTIQLLSAMRAQLGH